MFILGSSYHDLPQMLLALSMLTMVGMQYCNSMGIMELEPIGFGIQGHLMSDAWTYNKTEDFILSIYKTV